MGPGGKVWFIQIWSCAFSGFSGSRFLSLCLIDSCSQMILCDGAVLCILGCSAASWASTHWMPRACPHHVFSQWKMSTDTAKCPLGVKIAPVEDYCTSELNVGPYAGYLASAYRSAFSWHKVSLGPSSSSRAIGSPGVMLADSMSLLWFVQLFSLSSIESIGKPEISPSFRSASDGSHPFRLVVSADTLIFVLNICTIAPAPETLIYTCSSITCAHLKLTNGHSMA